MSPRNKSALLHSRLPTFSRKVASAKRIIIEALEKISSPYIAFSGGKDSGVVLGLCSEIDPGIPAVWSDDEWWLPETKEYMDRAGARVTQIRTNAWHSEWFQVKGDYNDIPDYARQSGYNGVFLGLRSEESSTRRLHLRMQGPLFLAKSDGFWHCNPIHDWSWKDVWAYILVSGIDYNSAYDKLEQMGIPPMHQRIGPFAVDRVLGYGQLAVLKRGWPDLFNRFAEKHPEAREYV